MAFKIFEASVISFTPTHPILLTAALGFDKESIQDLFEKYLLANFAGQAKEEMLRQKPIRSILLIIWTIR